MSPVLRRICFAGSLQPIRQQLWHHPPDCWQQPQQHLPKCYATGALAAPCITSGQSQKQVTLESLEAETYSLVLDHPFGGLDSDHFTLELFMLAIQALLASALREWQGLHPNIMHDAAVLLCLGLLI